MSNQSPPPITMLPAHYHEVHAMSINDQGMLLRLNVLSLIPLIISSLIVFGALLIYHEEMGAPLVITALPDDLPDPVGIVAILSVLLLHEGCHGLMIRRFGHTPRFGVKWLVMYATSDGAFFRRSEFVRIALAPLFMITMAGMVIMLFLPQGLATWMAWAIALNAAGSIGDLWMTMVALRFDSSVVIRDEADGMRIFAPIAAPPRVP